MTPDTSDDEQKKSAKSALRGRKSAESKGKKRARSSDDDTGEIELPVVRLAAKKRNVAQRAYVELVTRKATAVSLKVRLYLLSCSMAVSHFRR